MLPAQPRNPSWMVLVNSYDHNHHMTRIWRGKLRKHLSSVDTHQPLQNLYPPIPHSNPNSMSELTLLSFPAAIVINPVLSWPVLLQQTYLHLSHSYWQETLFPENCIDIALFCKIYSVSILAFDINKYRTDSIKYKILTTGFKWKER